ncbi:MAG: type II TA system antitoxin MqsA family protein [Candidatus Parabeggiatoa sp.]|nr:type II TA system antitoxin MqsA family protein [Candidatus Parabeggiatoa sp.]
MQELCFNCDFDEELQPIREPIIITVRGESIPATKEFYQCPHCGHAFTSSLGHDALDEAYREYRRRHNLLQPEEICNWREQYGLTQQELSTLLGWKETTLSKYENGALQEESQDTLLKFALEPINLLQLIKRKPEAVNLDKRATLIEQLSSNQSLAKHLEYLYAAWGNDTSARYNKPLDYDKKQLLINHLQILRTVNKSPFTMEKTL